MSTQAERWLATCRMKGTPMQVMDILARKADPGGFCWPSQSEIAMRTGLSLRTVNTCLKYLEECGYIVRTRRSRANGRHLSDGIQLQLGTVPKVYAYKEWREDQLRNQETVCTSCIPQCAPPSETVCNSCTPKRKTLKDRGERQEQHVPPVLKESSSSSSSSSDHVEVTLTPTQRLTYTHSLERAREMCAQLDNEELWKAYAAVQESSWGGSDDPLAASNKAAADAITQEISKRFLKGGGE